MLVELSSRSFEFYHMDTKAISQCLSELETKLDGILCREGFWRSVARMPESEFEWRRWIRETSWKRDVVELAFPQERFTESVGFAEVHLRAELRYPGNDEGLFDGTTVSGLSGEASGHYQFPGSLGLFRNRALAKYRDNVLRDVAQSLKWFSSFETPAQSLKRLQSGETSVGPIKDTGAARQAFDFLSSMLTKKT